MKIERLLFQINPGEFANDFIQADAEVWNPWLKRQPGFLDKKSRTISPGMVEFLIFWKSEDDLKRASAKTREMEMVDYMLRQRSPGSYRLVPPFR